jgi:flagellar biosynthesis protein FlhG
MDAVMEVLNDQADGLRRLMADDAGQLLVAVVGSGPAVGVSSVARNLAAAWLGQGKDVQLIDERIEAPLPPERKGRLVLIDAVLDNEGALSPLAAQADHVLVVLQPDPASIKAAYVCIKGLHHAHARIRVRVLVNFTINAAESQHILTNLALTSSRFLALAVESGGCVRVDAQLHQAGRLNLTVVEAFKTSPAAQDFCRIASDLLCQSRAGNALMR